MSDHLSNPEWSTTHLEVVQIMGVIQEKLNGSPVEIIQALNRVYESAVDAGFVYYHDYKSFSKFDRNTDIVVEIESNSFLYRVENELLNATLEKLNGATAKQPALIDYKENGKYE